MILSMLMVLGKRDIMRNKMDNVSFLQQEIDSTCLQIDQLEDRLQQLREKYLDAVMLQTNNLNKPDDSGTMVIPAGEK